MANTIKDVPVGSSGTALWSARTVHELSDAMRVIAADLTAAGGDTSADLAALTARVDALEGDVVSLQGQLADHEDRIAALEAPPAP